MKRCTCCCVAAKYCCVMCTDLSISRYKLTSCRHHRCHRALTELPALHRTLACFSAFHPWPAERWTGIELCAPKRLSRQTPDCNPLLHICSPLLPLSGNVSYARTCRSQFVGQETRCLEMQDALNQAGITPGGTVNTADIGNALANAWGLQNPPVVQCSQGYITQVGASSTHAQSCANLCSIEAVLIQLLPATEMQQLLSSMF